MKQIQVTGKTVEEAVSAALEQLQASRDQVEIKVLEESKKGFLGFGGKPALVEVSLKPDPIEQAVAFLQEVTMKMGVPVTITQKKMGEEVVLDLSGDKIAILIGKRGQTLNSLQYLTNLVANHHSNGFIRIILDAENYRERRRESLERLATSTARRVMMTKKGIALDPMPSNERKIIHMALKSEKHVETSSEGTEPYRKVIIRPVTK